MNCDLITISEVDFKFLLLKCIFSLTDRARVIEYLWEKLPPHIKVDYSNYRFCFDHYLKGATQVDGPATLKYNCPECQKKCLQLF